MKYHAWLLSLRLLVRVEIISPRFSARLFSFWRFLMLVQRRSKKISIVVGLLVGGQLIATSSTMFANPQVTLARMLTYSPAGVNPIDGLVFILMQIIGTILAVFLFRTVYRTRFLNNP